VSLLLMGTPTRLLVIGGSDAGISAALRAGELSQEVEATVVVADDYPNFSICGLPFYVSGETPDWQQLAHRTLYELEQTGTRLLLRHRATGLDLGRHEACVENPDGQVIALGYDRLVIATGARPVRPAMPGLDLPNVHVLHTMDDSFLVLQSVTYLPLGTTAHKQGRVAGENAVGGQRLFQGSLGTQVIKVFDIAIARTGLRDHEARRAGLDPLTVETEAWDHKAYYPRAQHLRIHVTGDRRSGLLLGAQILGHWQAEVAKRIDVYAAALFAGQSVDAISDLDLSYTPPLGSPWDAVQLAAQAWTAAANGGQS
jgi:NADPH-dependent 2,4-dienoyl-CoA reductase/sulfur reductase-like enzyme